MNAAMAKPGKRASPFLTRLFGRNQEDDSYVVERFQAIVDGDIKPCGDKGGASPGPGPRGRRREAEPLTATLELVGGEAQI